MAHSRDTRPSTLLAKQHFATDWQSVGHFQGHLYNKCRKVPIYYESRLAKLELPDEAKPKVDTDFEEATEGEEVERKERLRTKWAAMEAVVGTEKRLGTVAKDLVRHFEERLEAMDGKASC